MPSFPLHEKTVFRANLIITGIYFATTLAWTILAVWNLVENGADKYSISDVALNAVYIAAQSAALYFWIGSQTWSWNPLKTRPSPAFLHEQPQHGAN